MSKNKLTICIPTYNRKKFVCELVYSIIKSDLLLKVDLIIIDDGSTDGTFDMLNQIQYPAHAMVSLLYQEKNLGFMHTVLNFFSKCQTEYLMLADDDMLIYPAGILKLIDFLNEKTPDFVSPVFLATDEVTFFRGRDSVEKMRIQDFRLATDHGPGLVYRVGAVQMVLDELMIRVKVGCQATYMYFLGIILLYLFRSSENFWWYCVPTCGFRKTGAEPSNIRDMHDRNYKFLVPTWERYRCFVDLYSSLDQKTSIIQKKIAYKNILAKENLVIYPQLRQAVFLEFPELQPYFDGHSVYSDIRYFYSKIKSFLFYVKKRWLE